LIKTLVLSRDFGLGYNCIVKSKPLGYESQRLASIDIGTNTFRLLIARVSDNDFEEVYLERIITRLGEGISRDGFIKKEAIRRGIDVLKRFSDIISKYKVEEVVAVATSALREAKNSEEFLRLAKDVAKLDIDIISGEEEARKTLKGIFIGTPVPESSALVDIGGGSTEVIVAKGTEPLFIKSLDFGVVNLTDKYMRHDPPTKEDINLMKEEISQKLAPFVNLIAKFLTPHTVFIGTAGTITALSAMIQGLERFDHNKVHNSRISINSIREIFSDISTITAKERAKYPALEPERFDIIVPGALILLKLMEIFGFNEIIVSDYGLKEGILLELYKSKK